MPIEMIVRHCAPTLAGMKIGNLVGYTVDDKQQLDRTIQQHNARLNHKGIHFVVLKYQNRHALIYVYRKKQLQKLLENRDIQLFLQSKGYNQFDLAHCLAMLKTHLVNKDFPHEIGVFLGYPLADIKAFIHHKGANYKCVGCWKAYTNEEVARQTFDKYNKCTRVYCEKFKQGFDITRLVVAV